MATGWKMAASAVLGAALTAVLFLLLRSGPPPVAPSPGAATGVTSVPAPAAPVPDEVEIPGVPPDLVPISGTGVIRGRVTTPEGEGVGEVEIVATPRPDAPRVEPGAPPPEPDLDEEIRKAVAAAHRRVTGTRRATTNANGRYSLTGLGDAAYFVHAYASNYTFRAAKGSDAWNARPGATVDFVARAVVPLRVRVEGIDPNAGTRIAVLCAQDEESLARAGGWGWSPDRPVRTLAPGTWWLQAVQGDDRELASEPREVELRAGAAEATVTLVLHSRPGLRGTVVPLGGLDLQRADVYALRFEGDAPPPLEGMSWPRGSLRGRVDDETLRYSFRDIEPGRWLVWVTAGSQRALGTAVVEIADRMVDRDIEVGLPDVDRYVHVRVFGPDGAPMDPRKISFSTSYLGPGINMSGGVETIHLTDGSWFIGPDARQGPALEEHPGGTLRISVRSRELGTIERAWDPAAGKEMEFRFRASATLEVTVWGLEEAGLTGRADLHLRTNMEPNGISSPVTSAKSGGSVFLFEDVQPGDWMLVLTAPGGAGWVNVDRKPIRVSEGENKLEWEIPRLYEVRLEPAVKGKPVRFSLKRLDPTGDFMHQIVSSPEDGDAVFHYVPAGRYELSGTYQGERRTIPIDVPAQTRVVLE